MDNDIFFYGWLICHSHAPIIGALTIDNVLPVEVILRGVYGGGEQGRETLQAHGQGRRRLRHQECKHAAQTQIMDMER